MSIAYPDDLKATIDEMVPDLVATRRDFHEHPELAFEEVRTSGIVAQRLKALGLEVETGVAKTGVVGFLRGEKKGLAQGKTLAIRADMDALPIYELNDIDYRSQVDGKMHACGHDGHTAILLAVADILSKRKAELSGNIKFIFQPAEEVVGGAEPMIEAGVMQGVDGVIGLHLISGFPMGYVGVREGTVFASANRFELTVKGKGGHAAMPDLSIDPVVIAAQIILAMQSLISRETSPFSPAVVTIASIHAGTAFNIIPQEVILQGTMRAYSAEHRQFLLQRIQDVANGISGAMQGSCDINLTDGIPPCVNDPSMTALVRRAAIATVGEAYVSNSEAVMTAGSDDMACFLEKAPGCYFIVGAKNPDKGASYPHHHPRFAIDEEALPIGVEVLTRAALEFLAD
ncbi:MAG TPA: amidohydrolase [Ktedonobacteraceae bacterium]|jgi:amidohydrolase